jgi:glycosyltransferase involved in cell wall biosynthesis
MPAHPLSLDERYALRKKEGIPGNELFVSVGSFIKRKNELQLLRIWKSQPEDRVLLLIGNGPQKKTYLRYIKDNHLSNVKIMAYKPHGEILHYFALANASLFLTKEDIYGHVVNECLSQGTPVIASGNANAALKLINQDQNGRLVELESDKSIEKAIEEPFPEAMYNAALEQASHNTIEAMVDAHLAAFAEYLRK